MAVFVKLLNMTYVYQRYQTNTPILDDGNMVFIDRHNKLVNCVSSDFKVKLYERLQSVPKDVAYVNNKLVVATTLEINIYAIDNKNDTFKLLECHRTDNELVAISPIIENKLAHLFSGY